MTSGAHVARPVMMFSVPSPGSLSEKAAIFRQFELNFLTPAGVNCAAFGEPIPTFVNYTHPKVRHKLPSFVQLRDRSKNVRC